jgi:hypothetical protein
MRISCFRASHLRIIARRSEGLSRFRSPLSRLNASQSVWSAVALVNRPSLSIGTAPNMFAAAGAAAMVRMAIHEMREAKFLRFDLLLSSLRYWEVMMIYSFFPFVQVQATVGLH